MRLKNITVSGFKSFVDVTTVSFSGDLVGVVGPNGCGKSNVIDAVRWVMGESSAKLLRGDSMEDVIFNGSASRKPVGRCSVELLFDNSLGRIKSIYKDFAQISIKRVLSREGKSEYRINDKKVRRKDVLDLFRGTGLGPRSYSIIEQGMVSRIVEAKPEELRAYVEEAAGISKYKDRRRETETRIRQTRENIERSEDIRNELLLQLRRLKRQAQAAERFTKLQAQKREQMAVFFKLREQQILSQIDADQKQLDLTQNEFEKKLAQQREFERKIEASRAGRDQAQQDVDKIQATFYEVGVKVSKIEQQIEHVKNVQSKRLLELKDTQSALQHIDEQLLADRKRSQQLAQENDGIVPKLDALNAELAASRERYTQAQKALYDWQSLLSEQTSQLQKAESAAQMQRSVMSQLTDQQGRAQQRSDQLKAEQAKHNATLNSAQTSEVKLAFTTQQARMVELDEQVIALNQQLEAQRSAVQDARAQLSEQQASSQSAASRLESLEEFQQAALHHADSQYRRWLSAQGLDDAASFASKIEITPGWQRAADRVLTPFLQAKIDSGENHSIWQELPEHAITLFSTAPAKVTAPRAIGLAPLKDFIQAKGLDVEGLLAGFYAAESLQQALAHRDNLQGNEVIVCQSGSMYGVNWVSHASESAMNTGFLVREDEIKQLGEQVEQALARSQSLESTLATAQTKLQQLQVQLQQLRDSQQQQGQTLAHQRNELTKLDSELAYTQQRLQSIEAEIQQLHTHQAQEAQKLEQATSDLALAQSEITAATSVKDKLDTQGHKLRQAQTQEEQSHAQVQSKLHEVNLLKTRIETEINSVTTGLQRLAAQQTQLQGRAADLEAESGQSTEPDNALNTQLQEALAQRQKVEARLGVARESMTGHDNGLRQLQGQLSQCVEEVNAAREAVEQMRLTQQGKQVRKEALLEEASREGYDTSAVAMQDESLTLADCEQLIEKLERKIAGVGAVNLVAIEEYETQSERADYLGKQHQDLELALETLEQVIHKIDQETRQRFEQTYTALQQSFSDYFPKLFGGGRASLSLTSDDWLTTGVTVLAQPPGKRNSTIHLLSGGEKALTAVSLLFALFELNPAPFCMMDEVDAPLDDANVDRFCDTLKVLCQRAQIIVITHNKITMQVANSLIGVTMNEPGVSRVVSVDIDQATEMVK